MRTVRSRRRGRKADAPSALVAPAVLTFALAATAVLSVRAATPVTATPAADQAAVQCPLRAQPRELLLRHPEAPALISRTGHAERMRLTHSPRTCAR